MRLVSLFLFIALFGTFSCTKEKSFEVDAPAIGSLQSDASGDCLPKQAAGSFMAGTALADSNYLDVDVNVISEGAYAIRTDTVNGYSFQGSGNFTTTGINRIRLAASGTPVAAGADNFTVLYDSSSCRVTVTVLPAGSNGPAAFTLQGSGDSCIVASVFGSYIQNVPLSSTNTVSILVNVTTPGTYTVATTAAKGFSFSGSGVLPAGEQTIVLQASGTPDAAGTAIFTVTAGSTTCAFSVNVSDAGTPPPPGTDDLFPLSTNSWWSYVLEEGETEDTIAIRSVGTAVFNQKTYNRFKYDGSDEPEDEANYRREGNDYFEYGDVTKYSLIAFDTEQDGDILFLKENLTKGATWQSADFSGASNGTDITLRYLFTCTDVNATETINGRTFNNITKISFKAQAGSNGVFVDAGPVITLYFEKGVGLIYQAAEGIPDYTLFIRYWNIT